MIHEAKDPKQQPNNLSLLPSPPSIVLNNSKAKQDQCHKKLFKPWASDTVRNNRRWGDDGDTIVERRRQRSSECHCSLVNNHNQKSLLIAFHQRFHSNNINAHQNSLVETCSDNNCPQPSTETIQLAQHYNYLNSLIPHKNYNAHQNSLVETCSDNNCPQPSTETIQLAQHYNYLNSLIPHKNYNAHQNSLVETCSDNNCPQPSTETIQLAQHYNYLNSLIPHTKLQTRP
ncbi:hypothetical protein QVD17_39450 [Tagetes erecta]|uniref:Uncharacterized protein n=1 Tax=Tagetes erecta TaxID=13708 RepID=A0AAD8NH48_TARER|nr:hypothetical protein QVD17_39450 [Tagetes erecta]